MQVLGKKEQKSFGHLSGGETLIAKPYSSEEISKAINFALGKIPDS